MSKKQIARGQASKMMDCANYVQQKYAEAGYAVQRVLFTDDAGDGVLVQIKNSSTMAGGVFKAVLGLSSCATLKLQATGQDLSLGVMQGKWLDKLGAGVVSWFVLWPLFVTAAFGVYRQSKLLDELFRDATEYIMSNRDLKKDEGVVDLDDLQ